MCGRLIGMGGVVSVIFSRVDMLTVVVEIIWDVVTSIVIFGWYNFISKGDHLRNERTI